MTNKPILSVERDLIERAVQAIINTSQMQPALNELRALLDKPVQPPVADLLLASAHSYVKVAGETQNLARHLQSRIEVYFDGEPAAQYHSEPVALYSRCTILKDCNVKSSPASGARINAVAKPITRRVCHGCVGLKREVFCCVCDEEQPAPVAVQISWSDVEPWYLANEQRLSDIRKFEGPKGFALEVWRGARLNGVKP